MVWLKSNLMAALLAALLGAIVTYFLPKVLESTPSTNPTVFINVVEIHIPSPMIEITDVELLLPLAPKLSNQFKRSVRILAEADKFQRLLVYELNVTNKTSRRTKPVDIQFDKAVFVAIGDQSNKDDNKIFEAKSLTNIQVNALNPGGTARVIVVAPYSYQLPGTFPIKVLHDDQLVELQPLKASMRYDLLLWAVRGDNGDRVAVLQFSVWGFLASITLLIILMVVGYTTRNNFAFLSKFSSESDLNRIVQFAEYIKAQRNASKGDAPKV